MDPLQPPRRPRRWPIFAPTALIVVLALLWASGWFYASSLAQRELAGWREREAAAGRVYACATQDVGGFPFRIEVRCTDPSAELRSNRPPVALKAADLLVATQVYQPNFLISELTGPMTIGEPGQPANYIANWRLAQSSLRGVPAAPERVSIALDAPLVERLNGADKIAVFQAERAELHGRIAEGSAAQNPVLDLVLRLTAATAPDLHPLTRKPLDADVVAVLRGLKDFAPKPWSDRLRELQASGGTIEISKARVQQDDVIAVGSGTLRLSKRGALDGQINVTVVGLDKILKTLDLDRVMSQGDVGAAISALDRFIPGLGAIARQNAAPSIVAGLGALGQRTTLEGKPAISVPLRFADGTVLLGPLQVGQTPPLF